MVHGGGPRPHSGHHWSAQRLRRHASCSAHLLIKASVALLVVLTAASRCSYYASAAADAGWAHRATLRRLKADIATLGNQATMVSDARPEISRIAIVGERHSGTNFIWTLLAANLDPLHYKFVGEKVTGASFCAFKHGYQFPEPKCGDLDRTLVVVMFRNPYDWAESMHSECWCGSPEVGSPEVFGPFMKKLSFHDFILHSFAENPAGGGFHPACRAVLPDKQARRHGIIDVICSIDCKAVDYCSTNLIQHRTRKLLNFLNISTWAPNVEYVRHEDVTDPERGLTWLAAMVKKHSLLLKSQRNRKQIARGNSQTSAGDTQPAAGQVQVSGQGLKWTGKDAIANRVRQEVQVVVEGFALTPVTTYKDKKDMKFDSDSLKARSVWFNRSVLESDEEARRHAWLVNCLLDREVERQAGYETIEIPGGDEACATHRP